MRKIILLISVLGFCVIPSLAEICHDFDANMQLVTVDCITGQRIITAAEREQEKLAAEQARQRRIKEAEAKQKEIEKAIEKRKKALEKQKTQKVSTPKEVLIDGKTYYLTAAPNTKLDAGIHPSEWMISVYGGAGSYLAGEIPSYNNISTKKTLVGSGGLSGLYFINNYWGFGGAIEMDVTTKTQDSYYYSNSRSISESSRLSLSKLMLMGRLNINPVHSTRLYIPFGVGITSLKEKRKNKTWSRNEETYQSLYKEDNQNFTDTTFIYFGGMGLEFDLTNNVSLGLEGRYNRFQYKHTTFTFVNGLAKVNVKF